MSSPTPSPNDPNNNVPNLGSTGTPLIFVFLGAGLLVGAVFALLILRRFYPRRRRAAAAAAAASLSFGRRRDELLDEKPLLWDVRFETKEDIYDETTWDAMTPMSARFIPDNKIPPPAPLELFTLDSLQSESDAPHTSRLSGLRRHLHLGRSHSPAPTDVSNDSTPSFESPTGGYTRSGTLQVAVAVGMPRPRRSEQQSRGEGEYCLGISAIPWNERTIAKAASAI
ncbi:hypothetical protein EUX98_g3291 [Antrodiella citrinella]|uniref:Uncharacterized protein n=1 Tax=Antrodiella citrinella TaxID=2447956 RepID=A0A4S4MZF7_9APHY|nr:hypothetical protein EUX98_g3291 [Antrodiella citrinella]